MSGSISSLVGSVSYEASSLRNDSSAASATSSATAQAETSGPPYSLNPALQIDPTLGMAILQYCDQSGDVEYTMPSSHQIAAYKAAMQSSTTAGTKSATGTESGTASPASQDESS
jgi:hypothetical protein